ncbi:MAG: DUF4019 domain-containing protein, partial [Novosphingobium sp.]
MAEGFQTLTEKEKDTLRLLVRGYDAKSMARSLGLSVHTVNERLRDSRRKMSVSSSREAARLLRDAEGDAPQLLTDKHLGDAVVISAGHDPASNSDRTAHRQWVWAIGGSIMLSFVIATFALSSGAAHAPAAAPQVASAIAPVTESESSQAARRWLELSDAGRWDDGYKGTAASFQKLNTGKVWAETSQTVRVPLGALVSRVLLSEDSVPTPPNGYQIVKFRTSFANKPGAIETVSLMR